MSAVNTPPGGATQGTQMHKHHHGHKPPAQGQDSQTNTAGYNKTNILTGQ